MNVVIVGGGFAGVKTAIELSKRHIGKITLISDEPYFLHHATLYATATGKSRAESVIPLESIFEYYPNVTIIQDKMTSIDPQRRLIIGEKKQYSYDKAVIALGSVTTHFGIAGMAEHAFGIKSLEEIDRFHTHIQDQVVKKQLDKEYFIIGAGPTGIEMAAALQEYLNGIIKLHSLKHSKAHVTLVEAAPRIMPRMSETASKIIGRRLESMGIKVLINHKVEQLDDDFIVIDGKKHSTQTAIWTSGVANNPFFPAHPEVFTLSKNMHVEVNEYLEAIPNVYVLGDNNTVKYSGMAWPAMYQATFVAKHLTRIAAKRPLIGFRPHSVMGGLPVGENWGYVEWFGIYASGRTGAWIRRQMELYGYKQLLPTKIAKTIWRAHYIPEIDA